MAGKMPEDAVREPVCLGIDTSNYTTSAALFCLSSGRLVQKKKLLTVAPGHAGLRQSEALFQHVKNLPEVAGQLLRENPCEIAAVGVSLRPRNVEGSYMPCFLAGESTARTVAAAVGAPFFGFSHQEGHIAAALVSCGAEELYSGVRFIAFHVSGGTTEAVLACGKGKGFDITPVAGSLDLKAGQAVDRVGLMLGLSFPCGPELEKLALKSSRKFKITPFLRGADCSLSGIENKCAAMLSAGEPEEDIASYCIQAIIAALDGMAEALLREYPGIPLLFAGGVTANSIIREKFRKKYDALFAEPSFSSDNAAGIAVLAARAAKEEASI